MAALAYSNFRPVRRASLDERITEALSLIPEWHAKANCRGTDPEIFHPEKGGSTREAKRICARCEVRAECLQDALDTDERFGIRGGLSERQRRAEKKRAEVAA